MNRLDLYIGRVVLLNTLLTWLVVITLEALFAFLGEIGDIGRGDYAVGDAILFILLVLPGRAYQSFPMAALIGSLLGLGGLAAQAELDAFRLAGLKGSPWECCMTDGLSPRSGPFRAYPWACLQPDLPEHCPVRTAPVLPCPDKDRAGQVSWPDTTRAGQGRPVQGSLRSLRMTDSRSSGINAIAPSRALTRQRIDDRM